MTYPISITINTGERSFVLTLEEAEKLRDTLNQILPEKQIHLTYRDLNSLRRGEKIYSDPVL